MPNPYAGFNENMTDEQNKPHDENKPKGKKPTLPPGMTRPAKKKPTLPPGARPAGKKPTLRAYEMICFYFTGLASEEKLLEHIEKLQDQS